MRLVFNPAIFSIFSENEHALTHNTRIIFDLTQFGGHNIYRVNVHIFQTLFVWCLRFMTPVLTLGRQPSLTSHLARVRRQH
jgi:hypothetical protein